MIFNRITRFSIVGLVLLCSISKQIQAQPSATFSALTPASKHAIEVATTMELLRVHHYLKIQMNDSLSKIVFDNFISSLDANKSYFTKLDIDYFKKYQYDLDDALQEANVEVAFQIFNIFRVRANSRLDYVEQILANGFDYAKQESLDISDKERTWSTDKASINDRWRKIVKNQAIGMKLHNKSDAEIKENLSKRYNRYRKNINQYNADDVFQFFMNAVASSYDPHTNYFSPISAETFNIQMNQSLEGIGARLTQSMDYTVINEVIAGGPAYKSKQLQKEDKIIAVAQGEEDFVDVIGWRLQDVVQLIRGKKGSLVRLQILKDSEGLTGQVNEVRIIREKIMLEEQAAKAEMIPFSQGNKVYKLGVITLPSFYMNFDEYRNGVKDYKSASRDVQKLIEGLQAQNVDGILMDLRYNGGGSLPEAINLTGLFVDQGPIVQVKHSNNQIEVLKNKNAGVVYDGPLAVVVNRFSASASEIFSAAIQDYKRGVIIGETTFGKGTVQNMFALKQWNPTVKDRLGNLKFTLSKYYRVNGSSTQNLGVTPDITFPSAFSAIEFGESARVNALKWDQILTSYYRPTNTISEQIITNLNKLFEEDLKTDIDLKNFQKEIAKMKENQKRNELTLNLDNRREEQAKNKKVSSLQQQMSESTGQLYKDYTVKEKDKKKLREDPYLKESLRLLAALIN